MHAPSLHRPLYIGASRTAAMSYVFFWLIPNVACYDAEQEILWIADRPQTQTTWTKWVRVDVAVEPWAYGRRVNHFGLWSPDPFRTKLVRFDLTYHSVPILEFADRFLAGETAESIMGTRTEDTLPPQTSSSSSDRHQDSSGNPALL